MAEYKRVLLLSGEMLAGENGLIDSIVIRTLAEEIFCSSRYGD